MLNASGFSFILNGLPLLDDLSFSLSAGDYLSVIGPNGAGKSTLLKCLMRIHEHGRTTGNIVVADRPLAAYSQRELARAVSYVPQAGGWIPPFTVGDLLRLSRYPHIGRGGSMRAADHEAVEKALSRTGLNPLRGRPLRELSGGERQKAFLAAALAQGAKIMLLDEPASFLDPRHASELDHLLKDLNQTEGLTILTVTHDLNHPFFVGGSALVLKEGRQLFFGPAAKLLDDDVLERAFQHRFTTFTHPKTGLPVVLPD